MIRFLSEFIRSELFIGLQTIVIMVLGCAHVVLRSLIKEYQELLDRSLAKNKRLAQKLQIKCSNKNQDT
jgi:glucose-6-phosphate-specific signal transduction histidine kinase